jgi:hypothetical protein
LYLSLWLVPRSRLSELPAEFADRVRPVVIGGRAVVGTAWVRYESGGVLDYRELLSAVLVRVGARPGVSIVDIWVDSAASRAGGRELWGIPKELAAFEFYDAPQQPSAFTAAATTAGGVPVAEARISAGARLPGRWPFRFSVTQALDGRVVSTPVRGRAGLRFGAARWRPNPDGPLSYLAGRRPRLTLWLTDFRLVFGRRRSHDAGRAT